MRGVFLEGWASRSVFLNETNTDLHGEIMTQRLNAWAATYHSDFDTKQGAIMEKWVDMFMGIDRRAEALANIGFQSFYERQRDMYNPKVYHPFIELKRPEPAWVKSFMDSLKQKETQDGR